MKESGQYLGRVICAGATALSLFTGGCAAQNPREGKTRPIEEGGFTITRLDATHFLVMSRSNEHPGDGYKHHIRNGIIYMREAGCEISDIKPLDTQYLSAVQVTTSPGCLPDVK